MSDAPAPDDEPPPTGGAPAGLPSWIVLGGGFLAFNAGVVNAVGFLGLSHQAITHVTGSTTLWSVAIARGDSVEAFHIGAVVLSFLGGAILSGVIIQDLTLRLGRRYGVALLIESALLTSAVLTLRRGNLNGAYLASAAFGLQNAMATTYSGAVLRTTHMTGIVTDLGIAMGHALRRRAVDVQRLRLYATLFLAFFGGGIVGALAWNRWGPDTLLGPAVLAAVAGATYRWFGLHLKR